MEGMQDTICAPASGNGGAISIIRLSGEGSLSVADKVFRNPKGKNIADAPGYSLLYGSICSPDGGIVDEVLASVFRAPHSYTGENAVEFSCHASKYIVERIISLLINAGARMALPGEFTRRAYINGKMDLAQAEAVADVIAASSAASLRVAQNQLRGGYSDSLRAMRDSLLDLSVLLELELDFSEEDVEFADRSRLVNLTEDALAKVRRLEETFKVGNAIKNGVPVAIVGAPNSGKSTLLNALLGENRAIVSDIAGTTRDTVEETMTIDGMQYRFIDTAGIRSTSDAIERQGVERSLAAVRKADVVIWLRSAETSSVLGAAETSGCGANAAYADCDTEDRADTAYAGKEASAGANAAYVNCDTEVRVNDSFADCDTEVRANAAYAGKKASAGANAAFVDCDTEDRANDSFAGDEAPVMAKAAHSDCEALLRSALGAPGAGQTVLEVWNKADLIQAGQNVAGAGCDAGKESLQGGNTDRIFHGGNIRFGMPEGAISISALKGTGLDELKRRISESQKGRIEEAGDTIVTNLRHYEALGSARESLTSLLCGLRSGIPTDLVAEDLRSAIATLGSIWGEGGITSQETLARLFERHCIGK